MAFESLKNKIADSRKKSGNRKNTPAVYEDFKYMLQDVNRIYIGAKYTYRELIEDGFQIQVGDRTLSVKGDRS